MAPFSYSCGGGIKGFMMESTQYLALSTQHSTDVALLSLLQVLLSMRILEAKPGRVPFNP